MTGNKEPTVEQMLKLLMIISDDASLEKSLEEDCERSKKPCGRLNISDIQGEVYRLCGSLYAQKAEIPCKFAKEVMLPNGALVYQCLTEGL